MIVAGRFLSDLSREQSRSEPSIISFRSDVESDAGSGEPHSSKDGVRSGQEMPRRVSSRELQDYVEGRLAKQEAARVEAYLRENPNGAARVEKLRQQANRMRLFGNALLREEIPQRLLDAIPRKAK